jgi:hypothetical protein
VHIAVVATGVVAVMFLAGCGGGEDARSTGDGPATVVPNPPASDGRFYETRGNCSTSTFHVEFDDRGSVDVTTGDEVLASATFDKRELGSACANEITNVVISAESPTPYRDDELGPVNHETMNLDCEVPSPVEAFVHPIWDETGQVIGSSVVVAADIGGKPTLLVTAPMKPGGVHLYFAPKYCETA